MTGIWYSAQADGEEFFEDGIPGVFSADAVLATEGIARADGKNYALLSPPMRDRYIELAIGALEALGMERDA